MRFLDRYTNWLHTGWPAGQVEKLPVIAPDGATRVPGLYIAGDLTGIPLLKFAAHTGASVVRTIVADASFQSARRDSASGDGLDLVIVGAGVAGVAAALEARQHGLRFEILEASEPFSTIVNFPRAKPIFVYPTNMTPVGVLQVRATVKEALVEELQSQARAAGIAPRMTRVERVVRRGRWLEVVLPDGENLRARRVLVAIGRSGDFRRLDVPGEDLPKVSNRLHDPNDFSGQDVLVVGGGDSALEAAIALAEAGAAVTLAVRSRVLGRPKPENRERMEALRTDPGVARAGAARRLGRIHLILESRVERIEPTKVALDVGGAKESIPNDAVFVLVGREPPLEFLRRSGVAIHGEWGRRSKFGLAAFLLFCAGLYDWKSGGYLDRLGRGLGGFPYDLGRWLHADPHGLLGVTIASAQGPAFWYTLVYSFIVVFFGRRRIRRRRTPYVRAQTLTLMLIQVLPLFLLPEILLPWMGYHGWLPQGLADLLFPVVDYGHGREYWRAYGFVLAWPLMIYNIFTDAPLWGWIVLGTLQTFVAIPLLVYFFGKGAYCGWICSCGALAETLGDTQRHKMPHGPRWNRLNMLGQGILALAFLLLFVRIAWWVWPGSGVLRAINLAAKDGSGLPGALHLLSYKWVVDVFLAGVLGYGLYFWFSGRMWCRFACPLAALMHIYARFSRFRILADKKKCISCNVCTSVCHQGIDVMNVANKGLPMADPECVRCSACVQSCPTGVLQFGQVDPRTGRVLGVDRLSASPVQMAEGN